MNPVQQLVRRVHVPFYAAKLWAETLRAWGPGKWLRFWTSKEPDQLLEMDGLKFHVRADRLHTQMTDTFAIMESLHHKLYNRRFFDDEFRIGPRDTVIDIGGYIGSFAVPAARQAPEGRICSFEPAPGNFRQLEKNVRLNGLSNVRIFNQAVAASDRRAPLFLDRSNLASNSLYRRPGMDAVESDAVSLQTLFARENLGACDFLKIDCEGAEYEILMGLDPDLLGRIGKIACEYHEPAYYGVSDPAHAPDSLVRFLELHGFSVHRKRVNPYLGMIYAMNRNRPSV